MMLSGRTVLVSGAAGVGVGAGICQAVIEAGGRLLVNDLSQELADRAAAEYGAAAAYGADVSSPEQVEAMFGGIESDFGRIDGLVNNAGIGLVRPAHEASVDEYERLQAVDLRGAWLMARAFARLLLRLDEGGDRGGGSIVNITSVHAMSTVRGYGIYAAAKAGLEGLTRGLASELGEYAIRCNAVAPGYVHSEQNLDLIGSWTDDPAAWVRHFVTDQQILEREISPLDCGRAAVFLLSEMSRAITGQVLRVDGGTTVLLYGKDSL